MAQNPEKRFESIMDKLFYAPKSSSVSSSSSEAQTLRGKKRPNPSSALALVEPKKRADCVHGSQHSSTPAETSQAPLCRPWDRGDLMRRLRTFKAMTWFAKPKVISPINCARRGWVNVDMDIIACESCKARVLFTTPPSWTQQQVEKAASVFSLKLDNGHRLLCPWIDNVCDEALVEFPPTTPVDLIHKFRERSSALLELHALPVISSSAICYLRSPEVEIFLREPLLLQHYNGITDTQPEAIGNRSEAESSKLYYQAQKLISLCGWEPRALPYLIDWKEGFYQFVKDVDIISTSPGVSSRQNLSVSINSDGTNELQKAFEDTNSSRVLPSNPSSVVLDCKLCGASVGLWTFSMVPQPVELLKFVGYSEVNPRDSSIDDVSTVANTASNGAPALKENFSGLKMTIAGGPPPAKQNFKATISLPVIGRNLWAKFFYDSEYRASVHNNLADIQCSSANNKPSTYIEDAVFERDDSFGNESHMSLDGANVNAEGTSDIGANDSIMEAPAESSQNVLHGSDQDKKLGENVENAELEHMAANGSGINIMQVGVSSITIQDNNGVKNCPSLQKTSIHESTNIGKQTSGKDKAVICTIGENSELLSLNRQMRFDPIKQHRQFCPWVASPSNRAPGWKQTLFALLRGKEIPASPLFASSTSVIKVDDPVASVRRLFMSPSAKRMKSSR